MYDVLIIGGGYAGLWAAFSAAREATSDGAAARIALVSDSPVFTARVRLYEAGLAADEKRMPLEPMLAAVGAEFHCADIEAVVPSEGGVAATAADGRAFAARAVVLAPGSRLARPTIPGLGEHAFDIDTAAASERMWERLHALAPGARVDIVGGGFTGIELACEIAGWRRTHNSTLRIRLSDALRIANGYSEAARAALLSVLESLGIEQLEAAALTGCGANTVEFAGRGVCATSMLVWTAGFVPSALGAQFADAFAVPRTPDGRLDVTSTLALPGHPTVFAAGDIAAAKIASTTSDEVNVTTMSCQHALSTGIFAGHNAVRSLCGGEVRTYAPAYPYSTCLDLGPAGALLTRGFTRELVAIGEHAKATKLHINRSVIVPPLAGGREALFAAANVPE